MFSGNSTLVYLCFGVSCLCEGLALRRFACPAPPRHPAAARFKVAPNSNSFSLTFKVKVALGYSEIVGTDTIGCDH